MGKFSQSSAFQNHSPAKDPVIFGEASTLILNFQIVNIRNITIIFLLVFSSHSILAQQRGKATYYSKRSTGARTASGERLHHDSLVCAHRYYPFGTLLKVTNLTNNKYVVVRVIDRGPFARQRIIDLSWAAAKEIGMIANGVATVKVEVVEGPIPLRPDDTINLPEIDFEVADVGYSFIENWKNAPPLSKGPAPDKGTFGQGGQPKQLSRNALPSKQHRTTRKKKSNPWSNVFEKLKHWKEGKE